MDAILDSIDAMFCPFCGPQGVGRPAGAAGVAARWGCLFVDGTPATAEPTDRDSEEDLDARARDCRGSPAGCFLCDGTRAITEPITPGSWKPQTEVSPPGPPASNVAGHAAKTAFIYVTITFTVIRVGLGQSGQGPEV